MFKNYVLLPLKLLTRIKFFFVMKTQNDSQSVLPKQLIVKKKRKTQKVVINDNAVPCGKYGKLIV